MLRRGIGEQGVFAEEGQINVSHRAVALFGDNQRGFVFKRFIVALVIRFAVD